MVGTYRSKIVYAAACKVCGEVETAGGTSSSSPRCCAERLLLASWRDQARRHGVHPAAVVRWVRRKAGAHLVVWRRLCDGSLGCAVPCGACARELAVYDFTVHCPVGAGQWWHGRLEDVGAPPSKMTFAQRRAVEAYKSHRQTEHRKQTESLLQPERQRQTVRLKGPRSE